MKPHYYPYDTFGVRSEKKQWNRDPAKRYYFHKSVYVSPGEWVGFDGVIDFEPPILRGDGTRVEGASHLQFDCIAS